MAGSYELAGDDEIAATTQGSWTQYEIRAIWREEDQVLQLLVLPDIRVTDEKRGRDLRSHRPYQRAALARPFRDVVLHRAWYCSATARCWQAARR
jgi:hypothetical protein